MEQEEKPVMKILPRNQGRITEWVGTCEHGEVVKAKSKDEARKLSYQHLEKEHE